MADEFPARELDVPDVTPAIDHRVQLAICAQCADQQMWIKPLEFLWSIRPDARGLAVEFPQRQLTELRRRARLALLAGCRNEDLFAFFVRQKTSALRAHAEVAGDDVDRAAGLAGFAVEDDEGLLC